MNPDDLVEMAAYSARRAGELLLERFRAPATGVATKSSPTDLVSDADRDAERLLVSEIRRRRPNDAIVGEEGAGKGGRSGLSWLVDPLDGTINFLYGIPMWCVSVAVRDEQGVVAGVVHDPLHDEMFAATRGKGATLNGEATRVSDQPELAQALVGTGFSYEAEVRAAQAQVVARLLPRVRDVRRNGSAALDLCYVACGRLDAFYEAWLAPWDRAAGELVAREAGATVSDLPPPKGDEIGVVVANPELHPMLAEIVGG